MPLLFIVVEIHIHTRCDPITAEHMYHSGQALAFQIIKPEQDHGEQSLIYPGELSPFLGLLEPFVMSPISDLFRGWDVDM